MTKPVCPACGGYDVCGCAAKTREQLEVENAGLRARVRELEGRLQKLGRVVRETELGNPVG